MKMLIIIPMLGVICLYLLPSQRLALFLSICTLIEAIRLYIGMDKKVSTYQYVERFVWETKELAFGIDGIGINYVMLTVILIPICIMVSWDKVKVMERHFLMMIICMEGILIGVFTVMDILGFYVLYEAVLIPMFYIIGVWGAREQKITAAYYFFFYTLIGSVVMLISIMYIYKISGTTDYETLMGYEMSEKLQTVFFVGFIASLAVKMPIFPFHIWLPLAHVEAPVAGSVLLAGVLIKMGSYGIIRFMIGMFPIACEYFAPIMYTLSLLGVIYASITTIRQTDMKRIIAYSSVGHMGIVTIGIFARNVEGLEGSIYLQIGHGIVSSGLFIVVTQLYERYHTRVVKYFRGVAGTMPLYCTLFGILTMSNIGVPGTSNYVGEILSITGAFFDNGAVAVMGALGMILSASYGLFLFNRISFGGLSLYMKCAPRDLTRREAFVTGALSMMAIGLGIWPGAILSGMHGSVMGLISGKDMLKW